MVVCVFVVAGVVGDGGCDGRSGCGLAVVLVMLFLAVLLVLVLLLFHLSIPSVLHAYILSLHHFFLVQPGVETHNETLIDACTRVCACV